MKFKELKQKFLAALPVIGPHADIEVQLLLEGKKPLGWIPLPNENYENCLNEEHPGREVEIAKVRHEHECRLLLDEKVKAGLMVSEDVVSYISPRLRLHQMLTVWGDDILSGQLPLDEVVEGIKKVTQERNVTRHYCQLGNEHNLKLMVEFNRKVLNDEPAPVLAHDCGDYLGFRKRDVLFWQNRLPKPFGDIYKKIYDRHYEKIGEAYQAELLKQPAPKKLKFIK